MSIRDKNKFMSRLWDWGILKGCFGNTRIEPTDVDGLVERRGKFLVIEAKGLDANMPMGQRITLDALHKTGLFTVVIVWGEVNQPSKIEVMGPKGAATYDPADLDKLRAIVQGWYDYANN